MQSAYDLAMEARNRGERVADPTSRCLPQGMPRFMVASYPLEVLQTKGQVTIIAEWSSQVRRIFTDGEIAYCQRRRVAAIHFAGRFAAKEAAMKALGTGHSHGVLWRDIEVVRRGGPPQLQFHGGAARRFTTMNGRSSLLTITHSETLALAEVLLFGA